MSIIKTTNDSYTVDISAGINPITNKRLRIRKKGISSLKEAKKIEAQLRLKIDSRQTLKKRQMSFESLGNFFFKEITNYQKASYISTQNYNFNAHLLPYFINSTISKITKEHILIFRNHLKNSKLSPNTINKQMILLKKIFDHAVDLDLIQLNPCIGIKKLTVEKHRMDFWTPSEFKAFSNLIKEDEHVFKIFFQTLYFTGMRVGEALALTWDDIDLYTKQLRVHKTLSIIRGNIVITSPKTKHSNRLININTRLFEELMRWKETQQTIFNSYLIEQYSDTQIFQFQPRISNKDMFHKKLKLICERSDEVKRIRLHDFRHSHVALLIDNKEDPLIIKERLGHASITTTMDVYGHLFPNKQKDTADRLDELF